MTLLESVAQLALLAAAVCLVIGLRLTTRPMTARPGNVLSASGVAAAVIMTIVVLAVKDTLSSASAVLLVGGLVAGAAAGMIVAARGISSPAVLVPLFNAAGCIAAGLVTSSAAGSGRWLEPSDQPLGVTTISALGWLISGVVISGSLITAARAAGLLSARWVSVPFGRTMIIVLVLLATAATAAYAAELVGLAALLVIGPAALAVGVLISLRAAEDRPAALNLRLHAGTGPSWRWPVW